MPAALQQTVAALVEAAQQLDQDSDVRNLQTAQQDRTGKAERRYLLKRNGSNCSRQILKFTLNGVAQDLTTAQYSKGMFVQHSVIIHWYHHGCNSTMCLVAGMVCSQTLFHAT